RDTAVLDGRAAAVIPHREGITASTSPSTPRARRASRVTSVAESASDVLRDVADLDQGHAERKNASWLHDKSDSRVRDSRSRDSRQLDAAPGDDYGPSRARGTTATPSRRR